MSRLVHKQQGFPSSSIFIELDNQDLGNFLFRASEVYDEQTA